MTNNQQSELEKKRRLLLDLSYHLRNNYGTIDEILAPAMDILDRFLLTQRQQLISEIEGVLGEDTGGTGQVYFYKKQLRKEIIERLNQITNLKEK